MEQAIKTWCDDHLWNCKKFEYREIPSESINIIYDLLINKKFNEPKTDMELLYFGQYYEKEYYSYKHLSNTIHHYRSKDEYRNEWVARNKINEENMIKYYLMAIEKRNFIAMYNFITYYEDEEIPNSFQKHPELMKDYQNSIEKCDADLIYKIAQYYEKRIRDSPYFSKIMRKYYVLSVEKGRLDAINDLIEHYKWKKNKKNTKNKLIKYYLMAIEKGLPDANYNLAKYYKESIRYDTENDGENNMIKYYLMAVEKEGNVDVMVQLGNYYNLKYDDESTMKYYLMAINKGNYEAMKNLANYYKNIGNEEQLLKYSLMADDQQRLDIENESTSYYNNGISDAMNNLINYYEKNDDMENMIKYEFMDLKNRKTTLCKERIEFYIDNDLIDHFIEFCIKIDDRKTLIKIIKMYMKSYTGKSKKLNDIILSLNEEELDNLPNYINIYYNLLQNQLEMIDIHVKYAPSGTGYQEAKASFLEQLTL